MTEVEEGGCGCLDVIETGYIFKKCCAFFNVQKRCITKPCSNRNVEKTLDKGKYCDTQKRSV